MSNIGDFFSDSWSATKNTIDPFNLVHDGGDPIDNITDPGNLLGRNYHGVGKLTPAEQQAKADAAYEAATNIYGTTADGLLDGSAGTTGAGVDGNPYAITYGAPQMFMPTPQGGYWNQVAQQLAGPMYLPALTTLNPAQMIPNPTGVPGSQAATPPQGMPPLPAPVMPAAPAPAPAQPPSPVAPPVSTMPDLTPPPQPFNPPPHTSPAMPPPVIHATSMPRYGGSDMAAFAGGPIPGRPGSFQDWRARILGGQLR